MLLFIQLYPTFFLPVWCIQIHLMLLFILEKLSQVLDVSIFKYISCYCLSAASAVSGTINGDSNTSHVIVYPGSSFRPMPEVYSNTSHVIVYHILSSPYSPPTRIQIHLMLLFIATRRRLEFMIMYYSNTSHVIVYPLWIPGCILRSAIQIHLMLLFIRV